MRIYIMGRAVTGIGEVISGQLSTFDIFAGGRVQTTSKEGKEEEGGN